MPQKRTKPEINVSEYGPNYVIFSFNKSVSVNRLYRIKRGQNKPYFIHGKSYMYILEDNREIVDYPFQKCEDYAFQYIFAFNNNKRRDISNHIKLFEDIVFRLFIKDDDSRVKSITVNCVVFKNPKNLNYLFVNWSCLSDKYEIHNETFVSFLSKIS